MKGPALQYDIRALRTFVCDACGRQCPLPGRFTSCQCNCSTPPRWMRMLDRPPVTVPDVSMFLSPADPADTVVDENESDEVIPGWKPPIIERVHQNPQRRRLVEDLPAAGEDASAPDDVDSEGDGFNPPAPPAGATGRQESQRSDRGRTREGRERSGVRDSRPPRHGRSGDSVGSRPRRDSGRPPGRGPGDQRPNSGPQRPGSPPVAVSPAEDFGSGVDADPFTAPSAEPGGQPPERHSREDRGPRRGRRRGRRGQGPQGNSGAPNG